MRVRDNVIGALYHPPKPSYDNSKLLDYLEASVLEITQQLPSAFIILAGDFNQITDSAVLERTGLIQIVQQPTRGASTLDRLFVSCPTAYSCVRVISSIVCSDHKAIVASKSVYKSTAKKPYQRVTPT